MNWSESSRKSGGSGVRESSKLSCMSLSWMAAALLLQAPLMKSITEFGVSSSASAEANRDSLQAAINWASPRGAALWVEPSEEPYPVSGGVILKRNVVLVGAQGPVGRGTKHPAKPQPVGSVFSIRDTSKPFITVEAATQVKGIQFWYPDQTLSDPSKIVVYPPTIQVSQTSNAEGVTLRDLTFYGETFAMDFAASPNHPCEQILIEHCYGYPLSGKFISIDFCYDVPRILNCHVNPANLRQFRGGYSRSVIDSVVARRTFSYEINHTDNAQLMGIFTFGAFGGIKLGAASYGQLSVFNLDCVTIGIDKDGDNDFNRNWMLSNGSIIANVGPKVEDIHPIVVRGRGHLSLNAVEAFSGGNGALTTLGQSQDFLLVEGSQKLTVSLLGCRMRNYVGDMPITVKNPRAQIRASACFDKEENLFEAVWPKARP